MHIKLDTLLQDLALDPLGQQATTPIQGLSLNSQDLLPGEVFIAFPGESKDGRSFIPEAIAKGAAAVLCEAREAAAFEAINQNSPVPIVYISDLSSKIIQLANKYYGTPSHDLEVIGVTGTNGKTTSCFLLAQSLTRLGISCGVLGTLGTGFLPKLDPAALTTADLIALQKSLRRLAQQGAQCVAMEVSSHALEQGRVSGLRFASALFTNLTQDHLDFHGTIEAYGRAKQKLFAVPDLKHVVINADSDYAMQMARSVRKGVPAIFYGIDTPLENRVGIQVIEYQLDQKGILASLETPWGAGTLRSPLLGKFNLSNLLGVLAELGMRGFSLPEMLHALSYPVNVPGRMQRFGGIRTPQVIVDYAHTPDALEQALKAARLHARRRLWCVFGCGGDRDPEKRLKMGNIALKYADKVVVTSDNPRSEDPHKIIRDILLGLTEASSDKLVIEVDRFKAIEFAIQHALPVDTILVAGKGHENYQIIQDKKLPFSDIETVAALLGEDTAL